MKSIFSAPLNIIYDDENCQTCGLCSKVCTTGKIRTGDDKRPIIDNGAPCLSCGQCIAVCPSQALSTDTTGFAAPKQTKAYRKGIDPVILATYLKSRRSVRIWKDKPVPQEILRDLIDIASFAPSACNIHPVKWVVVADPGKIQEFVKSSVAFLRTLPEDHPVKDDVSQLVVQADLGFDPICRNAPALLIATTDSESPFFKEDSIISLAYIDAYAPSIDIGTCWVGFVLIILTLNPELGKILGIPDGWIPQAAMIAGYPGVKYSRIPPREIPEIIFG
jgi:nitroreductase/NAD-dependent dihydropyrimidine dehydrogenase PreA subunit